MKRFPAASATDTLNRTVTLRPRFSADRTVRERANVNDARTDTRFLRVDLRFAERSFNDPRRPLIRTEPLTDTVTASSAPPLAVTLTLEPRTR